MLGPNPVAVGNPSRASHGRRKLSTASRKASFHTAHRVNRRSLDRLLRCCGGLQQEQHPARSLMTPDGIAVIS